MVECYIARINLTQEEQLMWSPPVGIDTILLEREDPNTIAVAFVGSDIYMEEEWRKTAVEIRNDVLSTLKGRIITDNMDTHPNLPPRLLKVETFIDHPNMLSQGSGATREIRKAAEAATEVHDVEMTKEQLHGLERPTNGRNIEDYARKETKKQMIRRRGNDGRIITEETGKTEEIYKMAFGITDIG